MAHSALHLGRVPGSSRSIHKGVLVSMLFVHGLLLGRIAAVNSPTYDEIAHLPAGLAHWRFGTFGLYKVNPPLMRMIATLPLLAMHPETDWTSFSDNPYIRSEFAVGYRFLEVNGYDSFWYFTLCRWMQIPVSILGGWVCYCWARDLYGDSSGLVALALWCFCPNILAWGATITPDLGATVFGVAAGYAFWRWLTSPSWSATLMAGLALGLAELSKSTWIVLFAVWPIMWLAWRWHTRSLPVNRPPAAQLGVALMVAIYVLNLGYAFEGFAQPLGQFQFISRSLSGIDSDDSPGNRFRGTILEGLPVPVPANYLRGIDIQKHDFELGKWSYLRGELRFGGWYHYYVYALAVKTPLGTLILAAMAAACMMLRSDYVKRFQDEMVLLVPAIAVLVLVSSQTGFNRYLRYAVPALPFFYISASRLGLAFERRSRWVRSLTLLSLLSSSLTSLMVFPHSMSFFNLAVGGPIGGAKHLLDANIDWGQDLLHLKQFVALHPEVSPIRVVYFGLANPRLADFNHVLVSETASLDTPASEISLIPGWYAVSVNYLCGYRHDDTDARMNTVFQRFSPDFRAGYSICIYHITPHKLASLQHPQEVKR